MQCYATLVTYFNMTRASIVGLVQSGELHYCQLEQDAEAGRGTVEHICIFIGPDSVHWPILLVALVVVRLPVSQKTFVSRFVLLTEVLLIDHTVVS